MASKLPTVAIIGQANVGKSSLFNRMVRAQQAIVAREAGTTRVITSEPDILDGLALEMLDR